MKIIYRQFLRNGLAILIMIALVTLMSACSATATSTTESSTAATLSSITISPAQPSKLAVGSNQSFTAAGKYSNGSTLDITYQVTWSSSNTAAATISAIGITTGVAPGTTNITASLSGLTCPAAVLTVVPTPKLTSIAVTPGPQANLAVGSTQQFTANGTFSDSSMANITSVVTWTSNATKVATISPAGLANGIAIGTTNITASLSGITSPVITLIVTPTASSITVTPASPASLAVGATQQFTAKETYSDGSTTDVTSQVTWTSDTTSIATISSAGLATGVAAGTTNITASISGLISPAVVLTVVAH